MLLFRLLFLFLLVSCGMNSINDTKVVEECSRIKVVVLGKGDLEYDLHQILKSYLDVNSDQQPKYRLEVKLNKTETGYAVDNYSNYTRNRVKFTVDYKLINIASGEILVESSDFDVQTYDISFESEYSNYTGEKYSEKVLSQAVSAEISTKLKAYFLREEAYNHVVPRG